MKFHNYYHFVPFLPPSGGVSRNDFENKRPAFVTHDRYIDGKHSGQILCRMQTETPIFVGGRRGDGSPTPVDNYTLNGKPAIPASSIRGMTSSVAEAASNSAFRILDMNQTYSVRKPLGPPWALSAIGMVIVGPGGSLNLQPVCIPTLRADRNGIAVLPREFRPLFPEPLMKVYVGNRNSIRDERRFSYRTFRLDAPKWYALPLLRRKWGAGFTLPDDEFQHRKPFNTRNFVLAQNPNFGANEPVPYDQVDPKRQDDYVVGVMRVLGCWGARTDSMPSGKTHELFLPWPTRTDWPVVPIPDEVRDDFEVMSKARHEATEESNRKKPTTVPLLPFEPRDTSRGGRKGELSLKAGDLVYFNAERDGIISEVAFSAIWRKPVRNGGRRANARDFFPSELWPFNKERKTLSPAELLFGFVEVADAKNEQKAQQEADAKGVGAKQPPSLALAGRVRFSAALPDGPLKVHEDGVTLKVLDSPKPPSPAFYFKPRGTTGGGFIGKVDLDASKHEAQGRKVYLHQSPMNQPWKSRSPEANKDQQSRVHPVEGTFFFTVDFDNLSDEELGLLLYALKPVENFRHKIGMGKGIGLGTVNIETLRIALVDRKGRYTPAGLNHQRFHKVQLAPGAESVKLPALYSLPSLQASEMNATGLFALREKYRSAMAPQIRAALELLGDKSAAARYPVLPPLIEGEKAEEKSFRWFVANETGIKDEGIEAQCQFLRPLIAPAGQKLELPTLEQPRSTRR